MSGSDILNIFIVCAIVIFVIIMGYYLATDSDLRLALYQIENENDAADVVAKQTGSMTKSDKVEYIMEFFEVLVVSSFGVYQFIIKKKGW